MPPELVHTHTLLHTDHVGRVQRSRAAAERRLELVLVHFSRWRVFAAVHRTKCYLQRMLVEEMELNKHTLPALH
jgi:hypothetical protein